MTPRLRLAVLFSLALALFTTALVSGSVGTFAIGSWTAIEPSLESRSGAAAAQLADGTVLVAGGETASGVTNSAEIYDVNSGLWSSADALLDGRAGHTMTALKDGRVAMAGGGSGAGVLSSIELLDPSTGQRSMGPSLIAARRDHGAAQLPDGRLLIVGGTDGANALTSTEVVDLESGDVTAGPDLPQPRTGVTASALLNGNVLIAGGNNGEQDLASTLIYNPATGSFTAGASLTTPRSGHAATVLPNNNSVLIAGGKSGDAQLSSAELYVYWQSVSRSTGSMGAARSGAAAAGTGAEGVAMITGGSGNSAEAYGFATVMTDTDDYSPGTTVFISGSGWHPGETVSLALDEAPALHSRRLMTAVADASGQISNWDFAPEPHDVGVRFYLTATGNSSGRTARATFTDSVSALSLVSPTNSSPAVVTTLPTSIAVTFNYTSSATGTTTGTVEVRSGSTTVASVGPTVIASGIGRTATLNVSLPSSLGNATYGVRVTVANAVSGGAPAQQVNQNNAIQINVPADSTPPSVTPNVTGTLGANGWYTSDVDVTWTVTDPDSTVTSQTGCGPSSVTTDTTGVTFTCSATSAGGTASQSVTIKRDATAPTATLAVTAGTLGDNGWYTTDVTVTTSGADSISGATCTSPQVISTETSGTEINGSCTNGAGLTTDADSLIVKLDKTGPTAALAVTAGTAGANGWYTSNITIGTSGTDSISSPVTCTADQFQTTETAGATFNGSCTNAAGISTNASPLTVKLDKTGPSATLSIIAGTEGANGWYTSDVTVDTDGTDTLSTPVVCSADQVISTEGAAVAVNGSCTNDAGLTTHAAPLSLKIDKTGPTATLAVTAGTAGANGWYTSNVTVSTTGADTVSSPVTCSADQFQNDETTGAVFNGSCTNDAGLSTNAEPLTVKLDKTGPTAALSVIAGTAGTNGWYISDVTVDTDGSDSISAPVVCTANQVISTEGAAVPVSGSCTNDAGLSTAAAALSLKIDKTAPILSPGVSPNPVLLNGSATASPNASDLVSGVLSSSCGTVDTSSVGSHSVSCTATDNAGNTANAPASYSVQYASGGLCLGSAGHQILEPVNVTGTSVFKQKSTVPAKFRVCDANGNSIGTAGVVSSFRLIQVLNGLVVTEVNEPVEATNNDVAFRWSPIDLQWIFNLNTKNLHAGKTYVYQILLNDGSSIYFQFGLK